MDNWFNAVLYKSNPLLLYGFPPMQMCGSHFNRVRLASLFLPRFITTRVYARLSRRVRALPDPGVQRTGLHRAGALRRRGQSGFGKSLSRYGQHGGAGEQRTHRNTHTQSKVDINYCNEGAGDGATYLMTAYGSSGPPHSHF